MIYTLSDIYLDYLKKGGKIGKSTFKNIIADFNIMAMQAIIYEGRVLDMRCGLSNICIMQIKRSPNHPAIDWYESNKLKQQLLAEGKELYNEETGKGEQWLVYFTDDKYCRFYWSKKFVKLPNKSVYRFEPTRGLKGNKEMLKEHLRKHPINILKYRRGNF